MLLSQGKGSSNQGQRRTRGTIMARADLKHRSSTDYDNTFLAVFDGWVEPMPAPSIPAKARSFTTQAQYDRWLATPQGVHWELGRWAMIDPRVHARTSPRMARYTCPTTGISGVTEFRRLVDAGGCPCRICPCRARGCTPAISCEECTASPRVRTITTAARHIAMELTSGDPQATAVTDEQVHTWACRICSTAWEASPRTRVAGGGKCPTCSPAVRGAEAILRSWLIGVVDVASVENGVTSILHTDSDGTRVQLAEITDHSTVAASICIMGRITENLTDEWELLPVPATLVASDANKRRSAYFTQGRKIHRNTRRFGVIDCYRHGTVLVTIAEALRLITAALDSGERWTTPCIECRSHSAGTLAVTLEQLDAIAADDEAAAALDPRAVHTTTMAPRDMAAHHARKSVSQPGAHLAAARRTHTPTPGAQTIRREPAMVDEDSWDEMDVSEVDDAEMGLLV